MVPQKSDSKWLRYILLKVFGQDAEMLVETFGEVGRGTEADDVGNLVHTVLLLAQQFGSFLQAYRADEIVRGTRRTSEVLR